MARAAPGSPLPPEVPMLKLARWSTAHRRSVVVGWIVLIVAVGALASSAGTEYSNNFTLPNSDAQRASDLLEHSFPTQAGDRDQIVFRVAHGSVLDPGVRTHERDVRRSQKTAARLRGDQPLRGTVGRQGDLR